MKSIGNNKYGFSIVELLIVIVVIAILTSIGIVGYQQVKKNAASNAMASDLSIAAARMEYASQDIGWYYPSNLEQLQIETSDDVSILLITEEVILEPEDPPEPVVYYFNLSEPQKGKLLYLHCQDLMNEGYGDGPAQYGGGTVNYIQGCFVYNNPEMQIHAWVSQNFNVNVTEATLMSWVTASESHSNPNYGITARTFMEELINRYTSQGGTFPITSFWDPWANQWAGVQEPNMPDPESSPPPPEDPPESPSSNPQGNESYCIEATHAFYDDLHWKIDSATATPEIGTCE